MREVGLHVVGAGIAAQRQDLLQGGGGGSVVPGQPLDSAQPAEGVDLTGRKFQRLPYGGGRGGVVPGRQMVATQLPQCLALAGPVAQVAE